MRLKTLSPTCLCILYFTMGFLSVSPDYSKYKKSRQEAVLNKFPESMMSIDMKFGNY